MNAHCQSRGLLRSSKYVYVLLLATQGIQDKPISLSANTNHRLSLQLSKEVLL